jgi:hypothetical protein
MNLIVAHAEAFAPSHSTPSLSPLVGLAHERALPSTLNALWYPRALKHNLRQPTSALTMSPPPSPTGISSERMWTLIALTSTSIDIRRNMCALGNFNHGIRANPGRGFQAKPGRNATDMPYAARAHHERPSRKDGSRTALCSLWWRFIDRRARWVHGFGCECPQPAQLHLGGRWERATSTRVDAEYAAKDNFPFFVFAEARQWTRDKQPPRQPERRNDSVKSR